MSSIDETVQLLFAKLDDRKEEVSNLRASIAKGWKTNCTFVLFGNSAPINIQTAPEIVIHNCAIHLAWLQESIVKASAMLGVDVESKVQGYTIDAWISDFKKRLATLNIRESEKRIEELEVALNNLLSPEERRRIEVERLAEELGI